MGEVSFSGPWPGAASGLGSFSPHLCFSARVALAPLSDVVANYTRVSVALVHQKALTPIRPVL